MDVPSVIYKEDKFAAVYKPAGLLVHSAKPGIDTEPTLVDWLKTNFPQIKDVGDAPDWRPGIVHRLDKATSGVMAIPLNQEYFIYLKSLFQNGEIKKYYFAWVFGEPKEKIGSIDNPIGLGSGTLKRSIRGKRMVKVARTDYEFVKSVIFQGEKISLLRVAPKTGRTHQIRVHLSSKGHPIVGDVLYGKKKQPPWAKRLMLHAFSLEWVSSDGKKVKIESDPPLDFLIDYPQ